MGTELRPTTDILWLDNDVSYVEPYLGVLTDEGYSATVVPDVSGAEELLRAGRFRLVIVDVMIPLQTAEEERHYEPNLTDRGHRTGVLFYKRWRAALAELDTKILVFTVRLDRKIRDDLRAVGLGEDSFATKMSLRDAQLFLQKIRNLIGDPFERTR